MEKITGHQSVRGRGEVIVVLYKTHWAGLSEPSWEREVDLHLSRSHILRYWAGTPDQHRQTNRLYRRCGLVRHSVSSLGTTGNDFWRRATLVSHARSGSTTTAIRLAHVWYKGDDGLWWLGKISASTTDDGVYLV